MTEPSESFKAWHSKRAASILKRAEELADDYIKEGFAISRLLRRQQMAIQGETP